MLDVMECSMQLCDGMQHAAFGADKVNHKCQFIFSDSQAVTFKGSNSQ